MGSFRRYLLSERGLSAGTVRGYVDRATRFVAGLGPGGLRHVTPAEVTTAVLRESAAVSVSATQNFVAGLRAFLRFCFIEGLIEVDLSQAALPVSHCDVQGRDHDGHLWAFLDEAAYPASVAEGALVITGDEEAPVVARVLRLEDRPGGTMVVMELVRALP